MRRSCSEAALQLGLTQSAVSKQIQTVEGFIGLPLFSRSKGGLIPNAIGARLLNDLRPLLDELERVCDRASREATNRKVVIVRVLASFADRWFLPRLREFLAEHPEIDIQFSTFLVTSDFDRGGAELEVRFGTGPWLDADSTPLLGHTRVLIAPPDTPPDMPLDALFARQRLVHAQSPDAWNEFFTARKIDMPVDKRLPLVFDITQAMVRAVRIGMGIAVVPRIFVEEELARGEVVNPHGFSYEGRFGYHLVVQHRMRPLSQAAQILHDWIVAKARNG